MFARQGPCYLTPFQGDDAAHIVGWVGTRRELFWLAPKTAWPLTISKVMGWPGSDGCPLSFRREGTNEPLGYLEVNPMPGESHHFWLGHCVLSPDHRGIGLGRRMIELALDVAFLRSGGVRTSLVVFPENFTAVECYRRVGFIDVREQIKYFTTTHRRHVMLQMTIDRERFLLLRARRGDRYPPF
jgi:RimJ/RimL family protein N-acetyltransferase